MPLCTHIKDKLASQKVRDYRNDRGPLFAYDEAMDHGSRHYLREWRKFRDPRISVANVSAICVHDPITASRVWRRP
jgi:hypothetical protein